MALAKLLSEYGIERTPSQIAAAVALPDPEGTSSARTYLMGRYAERLGFSVGVLQCWEHAAWQVLKQCHAQRVKVIINHVHQIAEDEGHYSTLMSIDEDTVMLDDPFMGPGQVVDRDHFIELWQPNPETSGHTLLAIDRTVDSDAPMMPCGPCPDCGTVPRLSLTKIFQPAQWTGDRWRRFFCMQCDGSFAPVSTGS